MAEEHTYGMESIEIGTINDIVDKMEEQGTTGKVDVANEGNRVDGGTQCGGTHYKKAISPLEYILANKLPFCEGNVVKYVTRHMDKNGAEDIIKAITYCQFILKDSYGITSEIEITDGDTKKKFVTNEKTLRKF